MAKSTSTKVITIGSDNLDKAAKIIANAAAEMISENGQRNFIILEAKIKDQYCHFTYEITEGVGKGFTHKVKGLGIVKDDLLDAFAKFNVHMAFMDDVFKHSNIEIIDIDQYHGDELATLYTVTGFKIKGDGTFDSIILQGNKYVSGGGRIELETPKVAIDNLSSYKWWNELKAAADTAREEVALYAEGKYEMPVDDDEEQKDKVTGSLFDQQVANDKADQEFENAAM